MHIELSPKYLDGINNLIQNLDLDAHTTNSFNASGDTIILSANKEDLQRIIDSNEESFTNSHDHDTRVSPALFEGLKAIIRDQMR